MTGGGTKKVDKKKLTKIENLKFHQKSLFYVKSVTIVPLELNSSKETVTTVTLAYQYYGAKPFAVLKFQYLFLSV